MTDEVKTAIENAAKATETAAATTGKSLWAKLKDEVLTHPQFMWGLGAGLILGGALMYLSPFK